jgi:hypothetical protein
VQAFGSSQGIGSEPSAPWEARLVASAPDPHRRAEIASAQRSFAQAHAASTCRPDCHVNLPSTRRGSAGPANGRVSPAAKSWAAVSGDTVPSHLLYSGICLPQFNFDLLACVDRNVLL